MVDSPSRPTLVLMAAMEIELYSVAVFASRKAKAVYSMTRGQYSWPSTLFSPHFVFVLLLIVLTVSCRSKYGLRL